MLQYGAIEPHALDILKDLMQIPALNDFYLVGGTALALYFGHRRSVDLDLFSTTEFNNESLTISLEEKFKGFTYRNTHNPIGLFGTSTPLFTYCPRSPSNVDPESIKEFIRRL